MKNIQKFNKELLTEITIGALESHTLDLTNQIFFEEDIHALSSALQNNTQVSSLILDDCVISPLGILSVCQILTSCGALRSISLSNSLVVDSHQRSITAIAQALHNNQSIVDINLANNFMDHKDILILANAIRHHPALVHVNLMHTGLESPSGQVLIDLLRGNQHLTKLVVKGNRLNEECAGAIEELLERNCSLVKAAASVLSSAIDLHHLTELNLDVNLLKFYQACDKKLFNTYIGESREKQVNMLLEIYIHTNFLYLNGCTGSGNSSIERLPPNIHYKIFAYLGDKSLWMSEPSLCEDTLIGDHTDTAAHWCSLF